LLYKHPGSRTGLSVLGRVAAVLCRATAARPQTRYGAARPDRVISSAAVDLMVTCKLPSMALTLDSATVATDGHRDTHPSAGRRHRRSRHEGSGSQLTTATRARVSNPGLDETDAAGRRVLLTLTRRANNCINPTQGALAPDHSQPSSADWLMPAVPSLLGSQGFPARRGTGRRDTGSMHPPLGPPRQAARSRHSRVGGRRLSGNQASPNFAWR
jgi:hypothetical protein